MRLMLRLTLIFLFACSLLAADRGPSTPAERKKAIENVRYLENNPLAPDAKEKRNWTLELLMNVPDVQVQICNMPDEELLAKRNQNNSNELLVQAILSSGAYIFQHPKTKDEFAIQKAGLLGRLKAYESILKNDPSARWPQLDELLKKRNTPAFDEHVKKVVQECSEGQKVKIQRN